MARSEVIEVVGIMVEYTVVASNPLALNRTWV